MSRWNPARWCLAPAAAWKLAAVRVVVGAYLVLHLGLLQDRILDAARADAADWAPVGAALLLGGPLDELVWHGVFWTCLGLAGLFTLGLAGRLVAPLLAVGLFFLASYRLSWGLISHELHLLSLHLLVLGLAPVTACWSADAWLAGRSRGWSRLFGDAGGDGVSWRFGWPLRLLNLVTVITYVLAGLSKVQGPAGWGWIAGENLRNQVAMVALTRDLFQGERPHQLAEALFADPSWLPWLSAAAVGTLVVELGAPVALLGRWPARLWTVGVVGMHAGIAAVMGIVFPYLTFGVAFLPVLLHASWGGDAQVESTKV